jgi:hypothetical protein
MIVHKSVNASEANFVNKCTDVHTPKLGLLTLIECSIKDKAFHITFMGTNLLLHFLVNYYTVSQIIMHSLLNVHDMNPYIADNVFARMIWMKLGMTLCH